MPKSRPRVFLDSNVIVSGIYSFRGAPGITLRHFIRGKIGVVISQQVLEEVIRTVNKKLPAAVPVLKRFLLNAPPEIVADPEPGAVEHWTKKLSLADASILAAALAAKTDYFITGDNHFFENSDLVKEPDLNIVTPTQFLQLLKS